VVILGPPNAGKSTLINLLADKRVSITSPIAGTTRDLISTQVMIGGQQLIITDTAGIRHSDDLVEKEGIDLARAEIQKANALIFVLDISKL
jgi:tRNA modification GTPase